MNAASPYDAFILDHIKNARNYRALADATHQADGTNPLCGDEMTIYAKVIEDRITDVAFQCACCGISMASASVMTEFVKARPVAATKTLLRVFIAALNDGAAAPAGISDAAPLAILHAVRDTPGRTKCAALPWLTLEAALDGRPLAVSAGD